MLPLDFARDHATDVSNTGSNSRGVAVARCRIAKLKRYVVIAGANRAIDDRRFARADALNVIQLDSSFCWHREKKFVRFEKWRFCQRWLLPCRGESPNERNSVFDVAPDDVIEAEQRQAHGVFFPVHFELVIFVVRHGADSGTEAAWLRSPRDLVNFSGTDRFFPFTFLGMTVGELIEKLKAFEPGLPVCTNDDSYYRRLLIVELCDEKDASNFAPEDRITAPRKFVNLL